MQLICRLPKINCIELVNRKASKTEEEIHVDSKTNQETVTSPPVTILLILIKYSHPNPSYLPPTSIIPHCHYRNYLVFFPQN